MTHRSPLAALAAVLAGCASIPATPDVSMPDVTIAEPAGRAPDVNRIADEYILLVLAMGKHDPGYVDAYYGPPAHQAAADSAVLDLAAIRARAASAIGRLRAPGTAPGDELASLRRDFLVRQLEALDARAAMLQGTRFTFDEESRALYDAVAPHHDAAYFESVLRQLEPLLPGDGPLAERYQRWRTAFAIPRERLDTVFTTAIAACRERTARHIALPPGESFVVEYVTGKPWSGYNWYKGNHHSLIQVNTDLPIYIDRAIDLACHEGYPGHHVYNALLESRLVRERGWPELTVYPLFSPQSLIAEGSANHGIAMAVPGEERVEGERATLFPLAGLDPSRAAEYYRVQALVGRLSYAGNEAARRYLDGEIAAPAAIDWLTRYALMSLASAAQRVRFFDTYRSYVINYNLGQDLVRAYVEREAGPGASADARWRVFEALLSSPRLPSGLR